MDGKKVRVSKATHRRRLRKAGNSYVIVAPQRLCNPQRTYLSRPGIIVQDGHNMLTAIKHTNSLDFIKMNRSPMGSEIGIIFGLRSAFETQW